MPGLLSIRPMINNRFDRLQFGNCEEFVFVLGVGGAVLFSYLTRPQEVSFSVNEYEE